MEWLWRCSGPVSLLALGHFIWIIFLLAITMADDNGNGNGNGTQEMEGAPMDEADPPFQDAAVWLTNVGPAQHNRAVAIMLWAKLKKWNKILL